MTPQATYRNVLRRHRAQNLAYGAGTCRFLRQ